MQRIENPRHIFGVLLLGALPLFPTLSWSASSFDDLRQQQPDFARLLTLAAPKSGLSKEQLDKAFDNIAKWALESKGQQVQDSIDLIVDKGRLDYLDAMREAAQKIRFDGDASEWPEWTCLWRGNETPWLLHKGDVTAIRAIFDGSYLGLAVDLPRQSQRDQTETYWVSLDYTRDDAYECSVKLTLGGKMLWYSQPGLQYRGSTDFRLGAQSVVEVCLPPDLVSATPKSALRMHFVGSQRQGGSWQTVDLEIPMVTGLQAARSLLRDAADRGTPPEAPFSAQTLETLRRDTGTYASVRRRGELYLLLDDGEISKPIVAGEGVARESVGKNGFRLAVATRTLLRQLGSTPLHPDPYDFVVFVTNFPVCAAPSLPPPGDHIGYASMVRQTELGVGKKPVDYRAAFGSYGRLQHVAMLNTIESWFLATPGVAGPCAAHELAHHWIASVKYSSGRPAEAIASDTLTDGERHVHWSKFVERRDSPMGGLINYELVDLGDGAYELRHTTRSLCFSDLDLYLMGLLPPEKVAPFFVVLNPDVKESDLKIGQPFHGTRKDVTIQDIIAVEGPRIPDWQHSQKDFRAAFVLVTRGEMPTDDESKFVDNLRQESEKYWFKATRGLSRMDTRLDAGPEGKE